VFQDSCVTGEKSPPIGIGWQSGFGAIGMLLHILYRDRAGARGRAAGLLPASLYCVVGYFQELRKPTPERPAFMPPASILKPVRGVDHQAYENFASYCRLDYPKYEIIFAVADPDDPVVPVIGNCRLIFPLAPSGSSRRGWYWNEQQNKQPLPARAGSTIRSLGDEATATCAWSPTTWVDGRAIC